MHNVPAITDSSTVASGNGHSYPYLEGLRFLSEAQAREIRDRFGTPVFVYHEPSLRRQASYMLSFPHAFGLIIRYSIKACPSGAIIKLLNELGLYFDASSSWEARRALIAGVPPGKILVTAQEFGPDLEAVLSQGVEFDACSLRQLDWFGARFPGSRVSLRINPGFGSGMVRRLTSGGSDSSFGLWHEQLDEAFLVTQKHKLHIVRIHEHIGSGHDSQVWLDTAAHLLSRINEFPEVESLNLGGGYQIKGLSTEVPPDHYEFGKLLKSKIQDVAERTGKKIKVELEPGTFLTANSGAIVSSVVDVVKTGSKGRTFIKIDSGLTEIIRPSFYGSPHPMVSVPGVSSGQESSNGAVAETREYVVVGHCCIAGDALTITRGNPEILCPHRLRETKPGDILVIERSGGYCSSMALKNFNSFPEAPEVLLQSDGSMKLIRRRQTLEQMIENETPETEESGGRLQTLASTLQ